MNAQHHKAPVLHSLAKRLRHSSPTLVAIVASAGVVGTAVLAVKATPKALERIEADSRKNHNGDPNAATLQEKVKSAWTCYIPAAALGTATIFCIFASNYLNRKQQASLAATYNLISKQYDQYKGKVKEIYGQEAHDRIIRELAAETVDDRHCITAKGFCSTDLDFEGATEERRLFYDRFSERYFESTIGKVLQAEYHLNRNLTLRGDVSLNEFYSFLGIEPIEGGDGIGWFIDDDEIYWIDFNHPRSQIDDGPAQDPIDCWIIDPVFDPHPPANNW